MFLRISGRRILLFLATILAVPTVRAQGQSIYGGSGRIANDLLGVNENFQNQGLSFTATAGGSIGDPVVFGSATISANSGTLRIQNRGEGTNPSPNSSSPSGGVDAYVYWNDMFTLQTANGDPIGVPPESALQFVFNLNAGLEATVPEPPGASVHTSVVFRAEATNSHELHQFTVHKPGGANLRVENAIFTTLVGLGSNGTNTFGEISYALSGFAYSNAGIAEGMAELSLVAVNFINGDTPEDRGYRISFASGMSSPNNGGGSSSGGSGSGGGGNSGNDPDLLSAPEPSSLALCAIGIVGFAARAFRRRRQCASAPTG